MTDVPTHIPSAVAEVATAPIKVRRQTAMNSLYRKAGKRGFDIIATLIIGLLAVPIVAILAICILLEGHNPFYSQSRIGKGGRVFRMWKLRTMVANADLKLAAHLASDPAAQLEWDEKQKLSKDPRITRTGKWLRRSSMDELPQLLNVLLGSMSLVGPRPMMVEQRESYKGASYYKLHPGMTGPWQVSERSESAFAARVAHDDDYYKVMGFSYDISLMLKTIAVVFRGTGT